MIAVLNIPPKVYLDLQSHLLPNFQTEEESAFVFAGVLQLDNQTELNYRDWYPVMPGDYESRSAYHFELKHEVNGRIIKWAHDLNACIIEFHSHIDQKVAHFSSSDWQGFSEFVPHVMWRLKGKPYVAIVVTRDGFDALVWVTNQRKPIGLSAIKIGETIIVPTNNSLKKQWRITKNIRGK